MDPQLWTRADLAAYLQVDEATISRWRKKRAGPPAILVGKYLRWKPADVIAWLEARTDEARNAS